MEANKLYDNISKETLPAKLAIVNELKSKIIDYIESNLIFEDEDILVEELKRIGFTFSEYERYSSNLNGFLLFHKVDKINTLFEYIKFIKLMKDMPSFLDGVDVIEEIIDKHIIKDKNKILELEVSIKDQNEYMELISLIQNCKEYLKDDYDDIATYAISKYKLIKENNKPADKTNTIQPQNVNTTNSIEKVIPQLGLKISEPKKEKKSEASSSILDIFKELVEEELSEKENSKAIINELYDKYLLKKGSLIECEIIKVDDKYLYLKELNNVEENINIKMRKIPLHNYRVGAKEKGYISQVSKTDEEVEIVIVKSLQSIEAINKAETESKTTKTKRKTSKKQETQGEYSEKYFKSLFNKIKSELGITMCNIKKCAYDSNYGALIIIDNKKKNSTEEIKFVESLMNQRCGKDIIKIIEFKYDAIEFLSSIFEIDQCDIIKGTGKYIVVNYDTDKTSWYKFVSEQINSMVNYKIEF